MPFFAYTNANPGPPSPPARRMPPPPHTRRACRVCGGWRGRRRDSCICCVTLRIRHNAAA